MKKISFLVLTVLTAALIMPPAVQAQSDEYSRLYEEFLKRLQQEQTTVETPEPTTNYNYEVTPVKPEPVKPQPKVKTSDYSVTGKVSRGTDGRYFITTDEKPSRVLRVYGQEMSKQIMQSVVYELVQLIGEKAFFNGKEVGISVRQLVPLSAKSMTSVKPVVAPKAEPQKPVYSMYKETMFTGTIEISSQGNPYLVVGEKKNRYTHRLLNTTDWKKAFQHAYKGMVSVRGFMTETGAIRYSEITK